MKKLFIVCLLTSALWPLTSAHGYSYGDPQPIKFGADMQTNRIVNVAAGTNDLDAVNLGQLSASSNAWETATAANAVNITASSNAWEAATAANAADIATNAVNNTASSNAWVAATTANAANNTASSNAWAAATATNVVDIATNAADIASNAGDMVDRDTAVSNGVTTAYIAADAALSNALASASGSGTVVYPVNPSGLLCAYTFDAAITNDWWGDYTATNNGAAVLEFDTVRGDYLTWDSGNYGGLEVPSLTLGSNWTVMAWTGSDTTNTTVREKYYFNIESGSDYCFAFLDTDYDSLEIETGSAAGYAYVTEDLSLAEQMEFHHLAMVMAAGTLSFYLDGAFMDSDSTDAFALTAPMIIGARTTTESGYANIDNLYVFDRALSSNEVDRIYQLEGAGQYGVQGLRRP